jgi:hypothetical protein
LTFSGFSSIVSHLEEKKAFGRWFKSRRCQLLYQGPVTESWHLGQKQVPRFCTRTHSMVLPQAGQVSPEA